MMLFDMYRRGPFPEVRCKVSLAPRTMLVSAFIPARCGLPRLQWKREQGGKRCRAMVNSLGDEFAFREWKSATRIKEPAPKEPREVEIPEEWKPKTQVMKEENLPVFKMVYDLMLRLVHESRKLDKDFRYTLGEELKRHLMRVEVCIYHANVEKDSSCKVNYISEAIDKMLEVKLTVRILHDSKQLSLKKYALLCEQMVQVDKNLNDWKRYHLNNCLTLKNNQQK